MNDAARKPGSRGIGLVLPFALLLSVAANFFQAAPEVFQAANGERRATKRPPQASAGATSATTVGQEASSTGGGLSQACRAALAQQRQKITDATARARALLPPRHAFELDVLRTAASETCLAAEMRSRANGRPSALSIECHELVCRVSEMQDEADSPFEVVLHDALADGSLAALELRTSNDTRGADTGPGGQIAAYVRLGTIGSRCGSIAP